MKNTCSKSTQGQREEAKAGAHTEEYTIREKRGKLRII